MLVAQARQLEALLEEHVVDAGVAPGACAAVSVRVQGAWWTWLGASGTLSGRGSRNVDPLTWFDLASLTKPMVAYTWARAIDQGRLESQSPLSEPLPWTREMYAGACSLELLASHRAGLRAHVPLFPESASSAPGAPERTAALTVAASAENPDKKPLETGGYEAVYSDLGYVLLGEALSAVFGCDLDVVVGRELAALGVSDVGSARSLGLRREVNIAPTEWVESRGGLVQGLVHDENAFGLAGEGSAGHAGLFGRALGVARFATAVLDIAAGRTSALSERGRRLLFTPRPGGSLRAGFDGKSPSSSSLGDRLGPHTFGHFGFTGTGFWCDPERDLALVLLTNRVCPSRQNTAIRKARPVLHDLMVELGEQMSSAPSPFPPPNNRPIRVGVG